MKRSMLLVCFALPSLVASCSTRWFAQAYDDNSNNLPSLVIEPEMVTGPVLFDVQVHSQPQAVWCLGVRLTNGEFFDGQSTATHRCQTITTDASGAYDDVVSLATPLDGMGALLAEVSSSCIVDAAVDTGAICPGTTALRTAAWPLSTSLGKLDAGPHDAGGQADTSQTDGHAADAQTSGGKGG